MSTIHRYVVEGLVRDVANGRKVLVYCAGPHSSEMQQLNRHFFAMSEVHGVGLVRAAGAERLVHRKGEGFALFVTSATVSGLRGKRAHFDVLVCPLGNIEERVWDFLRPMLTPDFEVIR